MRSSSRTKDSGSDRESDWAQSQLSVWDPAEERNPQRNRYTKRNQSEIQHRSRNQLQTQEDREDHIQSPKSKDNVSRNQFRRGCIKNRRNRQWHISYGLKDQSENLSGIRSQSETRYSKRNQSKSCDRESDQSQIQFSDWNLEEGKRQLCITYRGKHSEKQLGMKMPFRTQDSGSDRESVWSQSQLSIYDLNEGRCQWQNEYIDSARGRSLSQDSDGDASQNQPKTRDPTRSRGRGQWYNTHWRRNRLQSLNRESNEVRRQCIARDSLKAGEKVHGTLDTQKKILSENSGRDQSEYQNKESDWTQSHPRVSQTQSVDSNTYTNNCNIL